MRLAAAALFLLCACAAHTTTAVTPVPTAPPKDEAPWYGDLHALAQEAAAVRDLTLTQTFDVVPLDDDAFFAAYEELFTRASVALQQELMTTLSEFMGVDLEKLKGALSGDWNEVRQEQLIAFYHFKSHRLLVRKVIPPALAAGGERARLITLAHEVGHVLQDQLGAGAREVKTFDEAITWRAVLEGDATLTATLLDGARQGLPPRRAVERARLTLSTLSMAQVIEVSGASPKLLEAPAVVRELYLFPYFRGQRFIADLYQAGGLRLVNQAFADPPTRSDAIYSPQRWLDGTAPALEPLGDPPRRLGLLLLRTLLEQCQRDKPKQGAVAWVEANYLDDSFRRVGQTLAWATEWDPAATTRVPRHDGDDATDRAGLVVSKGLLKCLGVPGDELTATTSENVVGVVAFAPGADRERLASSVARTRTVEAKPARVATPIPPPRLDAAFRVSGPGVLSGDTWVHAKLGLSMSVTGGKPLENAGAALTLTGPGVVLFVMFVDEPPTPKGDDGFVNAVLDGFLKSSKISPAGVSLATKHTWTPAERTWTKGRETKGEFDGPTALHAQVFPVCGGKATVNVVSLSFSPSGQKLADAWRSSLEGTAQPALCVEP